MVVASLLGPLVPRVREPMAAGLLELAALVAAVALPAVVGQADEERPRAATADQFEAGYVVDHPARMARNWTGASGSGTVRTYWLPIRRRYTRVQAATWALIRFIRRSGLHEHRGHRDFLAAVLGQQAHQPVVPWSPAIPVGLVPRKTGGDTYHACGGLRAAARYLGIKHQTLAGHLARIGVPVLDQADRALALPAAWSESRSSP